MADSEDKAADTPPLSGGEASDKSAPPEAEVHAHHGPKILDEVLDDSSEIVRPIYKHPMVLDFLLAMGLLVATGGFTLGLLNIYVGHSAKQSIMQRNYGAAIEILRGAPLSEFFTFTNTDESPPELLNQALYMDAMRKLDDNAADQSALQELQRIRPGSHYFELAQRILSEKTKPSDTLLEGKAEHQASPSDRVVEVKKPILPPENETIP